VSRTKKDPLRPLTSSERRHWSNWRAATVLQRYRWRARALLAVSDGSSYTDAAELVGRALGDSVAAWVARFNQVGLPAVERQAGGSTTDPIRPRGARPNSGGVSTSARSRARWDGDLVIEYLATC